jgi:putative phage-type endonuclease
MLLTELIDITDTLLPEDDPDFFNDEETLELYETTMHIMEEFVTEHPSLITEPDFEDIFDENLNELMHAHFDYDIFYTEHAEEEMEDIINHAKNDFYNTIMPRRSYPSTIILKEPNISQVTKQLEYLRSKPQPAQRTNEWYEFRYNLITASNAYKAFENETVQNQLIYEKCKPLTQNSIILEDDCEDKKTIVQMVNTNSTLHWGHKYEPLSVKLYEFLYNTKIGDFGCIQHSTYKFLGASPDGINIDEKSQRYGRMLEIKNIVNREIDGIPKKEYWIQMQLQMEVCDLDECDFLETKFVEYPDRVSYEEDKLDIHEGQEHHTVSKGIIMHFYNKDGSPFYVYMPFNLTKEEVTRWQNEVLDLYQSPQYNYTFVQFLYWKLEKISCVLVSRNKKWFNDNIKQLQNIWSIIEKERFEGYQHRAPNRKVKKEKETITNYFTSGNSSGCLLKFNKDASNKINVIKTTIPDFIDTAVSINDIVDDTTHE